jgi:hypothetical protein
MVLENVYLLRFPVTQHRYPYKFIREFYRTVTKVGNREFYNFLEIQKNKADHRGVLLCSLIIVAD